LGKKKKKSVNSNVPAIMLRERIAAASVVVIELNIVNYLYTTFSLSLFQSHTKNSARLLPAFMHSTKALQPFAGPWPLLQFRNLFYTDAKTHRTSESQGRYLHTGQRKHRINAQTSMPRVGFEPTSPASERAKTVYALDREATEHFRALKYTKKQCSFCACIFFLLW
jgi:hypothetical protein